jgi:uncharacterized cupredoxin-like copper-binding protein
MQRSLIFGLALVAVASFTVIAVGCGGDDSNTGSHMNGGMGMMNSAPAGTIAVQLTNWAVQPSQSSAKAGEVTFRAMHNEMHMHGGGSAGQVHELAVARKRADGSFELIGTTGNLGVGETKDLTLNLEPGDYELQCNVTEEAGGKVVSHYKEGMHTRFNVS